MSDALAARRQELAGCRYLLVMPPPWGEFFALWPMEAPVFSVSGWAFMKAVHCGSLCIELADIAWQRFIVAMSDCDMDELDPIELVWARAAPPDSAVIAAASTIAFSLVIIHLHG